MNRFFVTLEASAVFSLDAPTLEVLVDGIVVSSASVTAHTGMGVDVLSFALDFSGSYPGSLSFRFNDGSAEAGRSVKIENARINGQSINLTTDLTATLLSFFQSSNVNIANTSHLGGRDLPTSGDLGTPTITDAPGVSNQNLRGTTGRDVIDAGDGNDNVYGGDGDDVISGGAGENFIFGGTGNDLLVGGTDNDIILGDLGNDLIYGNDGDDLIDGGAGGDVINGGLGLDALIGGANNDILYGEDGDDIIIGDGGADYLYGDAGNDIMDGGLGNDVVYGGIGNDIMAGSGGNDNLYGEDGDDDIDGGGGSDTIDGGAGSDRIFGGASADILNGGADDDYILGDTGDDTLNGDDGNDGLLGGTGADTLNGGNGNDILQGHTLDSITATTIVLADPNVFFNMYTGSFYKYISAPATWAAAQAAAAGTLLNGVGGHLAVITSATENSYVEALAGGNEVWLGMSDAAVADTWTFVGGPENGLTFWQGQAAGSAVNGFYTNWNAGEPNDNGAPSQYARMIAGGAWADQAGTSPYGYIIEWEGSLWNEDNAIDTLNGGAGDDQLFGGGGNDILGGDDGNDKLFGGAGNDTLNGGNDNDLIAGDAGDDTINGGAGADSIHGGAGADIIDGGADNDTIYLANGDFAAGESIAGNGGTDTIVLTNAAIVDFTTGTLSGIETITGSSSNDTVTIQMSQAVTSGMLSTINLSAGTDNLYLRVSGALDISAATLATFSNIENGYIAGSSGDDTLTLTSAQFNSIIFGSGTFDMGGGTADTVNLNGTTSDLNTLGSTDDSYITGVEIISFAAAAGGVSLDLSQQTEGFTVTGGSFADTLTLGDDDDIITAGAGADTVVTGEGANVINLANGDFAAGESITGGGGTDEIVLTTATTVNFTTGTLVDIDVLTGSAGADSVTMTIDQAIGAFGDIDMAGGSDSLTMNVSGIVDVTADTAAVITNLETAIISGSAAVDTLTITGTQMDEILAGSSSNTINMGASTDILNLTSTSSALNTLGGSDAAIQSLETISLSAAAAAVTLALSGQTEAFTVTGSANNDIIATGSGADTITAGAGADTIDAGGGNDTVNLANGDWSSGELIAGGGGTDSIVLTNATTVDFTTGTLDTVETLTGSGSGDTATMTASQFNLFSTINMGGGTDTMNVTVSGTLDISGTNPAPTFTSIENGNLAGSGGDDTFTLTGAQLNGMLGGTTGTIAMGAGSDTLILTATSTRFNTTGATDSSITGLETITVSGSPAITISISGQTEDFTINGGGGVDTITGGRGDTTIYGNAGDDIIVSSSVDTLAAQAAAIVAANSGVTYNSTTDSFYKYVNSSVTWTTANTAAVGTLINGVAGHLVQINNATENTAIDTLGGGNSVWIGVNDTGTEGTYLMIGGPMNGIVMRSGGTAQNGIYANWAASNPGASAADDDYIRQENGGTWTDQTSGTNSRYVIEWEGTQLIFTTSSTTIIGGAGADTITCGAGKETIIFDTASSGSIDTINSFSVAQHDVLDVSELLSGYSPGTSDPDSFVRLTVSGADLLLQVDADGTAGGSSYTTIATLVGLGASGLNVEEMVANDRLILSVPAITFYFDWGTGNYTYNSNTISNNTFTNTTIGRAPMDGTDEFSINRTSSMATLDYLNTGAPGTLIITGSSDNDRIVVSGIISALTATANLGAGNDTLTITSAGNFTVNGGIGNDTVTAGAGADNITGGTGMDTLNGGSGNDTFNLANGDWSSGESITGGNDTDTLVLTNAATVDFSTGTLSTLESFTGSAGNDTVTLTLAQIGQFATFNMAGGTDILHVTVNGTTDISSQAFSSTSNTETGDFTGSANADTVTMTGAQLNAIMNGAGIMDFAGGSDVLNLISTSTDLNALNDASLVNLETISSSLAAAGVTITLSSQSEGFTVTGSGFADTITGGSGADTIEGGAGNDTLNGNGGTDTASYASAGSAVTVSLALQGASQNTIGAGSDTLSNFENLTGSAFNDTLTGDGNANVIRTGAGNDTAYGGGNNDTLYGDSGSDTLYGESGNDTIYSGSADTLASQISAILAANSGVVYNSTTGSFYKYVNSSVTWTAANTAAAGTVINGVAGHLVHITTSAENSAVDSFTGNRSLWMGVNDATTEGTFQFVGGPMNGIIVRSGGVAQNGFYQNWAGGEPTAGSSTDDYVRQRNGGSWYTDTSTTTYRYVIEWEGSQLLTPTESTTLSGAAGTDTLYGSAGQDIFLFEAATWGTNDVISGYDKTDLDEIDIGDLLTGYTPGTSDPDAFARFTVSGADLLLQVDQNGTTGGSSYTTVATLSGLGTSGLNITEMVANGLLVMT